MGLLDDAIREHLDLKRRRGADPTEVQRAEQEALGPVRRAPEPVPSDLAARRPASESGSAYDHDDEGWDDDHLEGTAAAPRGPSAPRAPADLEPDFGDEHLDEYDEEPAPEPKRSRLSRIFGRPEPEPEYEEDEADHFPESPPVEPRARVPRELPEEPEQPGPPRPHPAVAPAADHTVEYDIDEALGAAPPEKTGTDEDVLEETPEFLQDTPDHDRLWFEQRPPRDFDFDG